ncbi:MAG: GCN5-related N-acetyltransferase [Polaromonas sp.]|nr:GCN5-related N-acetyltransferase [Polaromonas sp.]
MLEIRHNEIKQAYEAFVDGRFAGTCEYEESANVITFTHTLVQPEFKGKGIGSALAKFVLEESRLQGKQVVADCQFISAYIKKNAEFASLTR